MRFDRSIWRSAPGPSLRLAALAATLIAVGSSGLVSCGGDSQADPAGPQSSGQGAPARSAAGRAAFERGRAALRQHRIGGPQATLNRAIEAFEEAAASDPKDARILAALGEALLEADRVEDSAARLREAARLDPTSGGTRWMLGRALLNLGELDEALGSLDAALAAGQDTADLHHARGLCLEQLDRAEEAVAAHLAALERRPTLAAAHLRLSELHKAAGRDVEAEASLSQFAFWTDLEMQLAAALSDVRGAPEDPAKVTRVAQLQFELARKEDAHLWARRAVELAPGSADAQRVRGLAASMMNLLDEARTHLEAARRLDPTDVGSGIELAYVHLRSGRPADATALMDRLAEGHPEDVMLQFQTGVLGIETGDGARALAAFDRVLALDPAHLDARLAKGQVHVEARRWDEAAALYREVLELQPGHPGALQSLQYVEQERQGGAGR